MGRSIILIAIVGWAATAAANGRGQGLYQAHCARCHVVGQGTPVTAKNFIDITLAAQQHDETWLRAFLQAPYKVDVNSACRANLDARSATEVYGFLRSRVRPAPGHEAQSATTRKHGGKAPVVYVPVDEPSAPVGVTPPDAVANRNASYPTRDGVPPQSVSRVVPPPAPPKPQGMVRR
jgi:hypothetical protein